MRKIFTPSRLVTVLSLLTVGCAVLIANFSIGEERGETGFAQRAMRLAIVHDTVDSADNAKAALREYEVSQRSADKDAFLKACDLMAAKVNHLRQAEHMSEEQSDQIIDLCVAIRQRLNKLGASSADQMTEAGYLLDRVRRVVLGFGLDELRTQDDRLAEQTKAAAINLRMTVAMAVIEIFLVAGIVFLVVRLARLDQLVTVCAWSHRLKYDGQWVSLEKYLLDRFGVKASDGITSEQAERIMKEDELNGQDLVRLVEFEKAAGAKAREASRAIHAVRNHLTAVLCYSEMAGSGDPEAQREMAARVLTHATTISSEVDMLHEAVQTFNPVNPKLRVLPKAVTA